MDDEEISFEAWLETYQPSELAVHASMPENISDPWVRANLLADQTGAASLVRAPYAEGQKTMSAQELQERNFDFFIDSQVQWSEEFIQKALELQVPRAKLDAFVDQFATHWVDGFKRRQGSSFMKAIKASIRDLDRVTNPGTVGRWTLEPVRDEVEAFFSTKEMAAIFTANAVLADQYLTDYVDTLDSQWASTTTDLSVRRGVYWVGDLPEVRTERFELSSWSLGLGAVEQFAEQFNRKTQGKGRATIFSAPFPAVQYRIVAFAPFIRGMSLGQLELVLAPPDREAHLELRGTFGGITELGFD